MSEARTTDLYEVTMAMSYLREGMTAPATFSLFVRDLPPERGFPPGRKQVFRRPGYADVIALHDEWPPPDGAPMLETVMTHGRRTVERPSPDRGAVRFTGDLAGLPHAARRVRAPLPPRATPSRRLTAPAEEVRCRIADDVPGAFADRGDAPSGATRSGRSATR